MTYLSKNSIYSFAHLGGRHLGVCRLGGAGLGNLLLTWARYRVATNLHQFRGVTPTWEQLKLGPILRREVDRRNYSGLFQPLAGEIKGLKKWLILRLARRIPEDLLSTNMIRPKNYPQLVLFKGVGRFEPILHHFKLLRDELVAITRSHHYSGLSSDFSNTISVHVRRGDFNQLSLCTPISWYQAQIEKLRQLMGADTKVLVCSDGTHSEIEPILAMGNAERFSFGSSIADILALSRANVLVATGGSSFSSWASFLGRMPVIWPAGSIQYNRLYWDTPALEDECSQDAPLPESFLVYIRSHRCTTSWSN